jgi:hypothetical protein
VSESAAMALSLFRACRTGKRYETVYERPVPV